MKIIKVAHLISGPMDAGAALAVSMLTEGMNQINANIHNTIVTNDRKKNNYRTLIRPRDNLKGMITKISLSIERRLLSATSSKDYFLSTGHMGYDSNLKEVLKNFDIIHLHWIPGLVSMRMILEIDQPIVVTLRDMWHLTGGCHYPLDCNQYVDQCRYCPGMENGSHFLIGFNVEDQHIIKQRFLNRENVWICGISEWITAEAKKVSWLTNKKIFAIHNGVELGEFKRIENKNARKSLEIDFPGLVIGFCAQDISDPVKGIEEVLKSLEDFPNNAAKLLTFGKNRKNIKHEKIIKHINFSTSQMIKSQFYSTIDLLIVASKMESFGKVAIEAMHFGVPVLTFNDIGTAEVIVNEKTGFLVSRSEGFSPILAKILSMKREDIMVLKTAARHQASRYSIENSAEKYIELYNTMV